MQRHWARTIKSACSWLKSMIWGMCWGETLTYWSSEKQESRVSWKSRSKQKRTAWFLSENRFEWSGNNEPSPSKCRFWSVVAFSLCCWFSYTKPSRPDGSMQHKATFASFAAWPSIESDVANKIGTQALGQNNTLYVTAQDPRQQRRIFYFSRSMSCIVEFPCQHDRFAKVDVLHVQDYH